MMEFALARANFIPNINPTSGLTPPLEVLSMIKYSVPLALLPLLTGALTFMVPLGISAKDNVERRFSGEMVEINTEYPGGNVLIVGMDGDTVEFSPDLRTTKVDWFYYNFETKSKKAGPVKFTVSDKLLKNPKTVVGPQGPAVSKDGGKTWDWMGEDSFDGLTFTYDYSKPGEVVRFSATLPYQEADLEVFLKGQANNPNLKRSVLTKSEGGRDVGLLQIGEEGPGKEPVLITGRQHANEAVSSYVLEGFIEAAMSDRAEGKKFREKYVMYVAPIVDIDGVEDGDQGKNRAPHDHNRDWSDAPLYPETRALQELHKKQGFKYTMDFHCPTLTMDIHQAMYFGGIEAPPVHNLENLQAYAKLIDEKMPDKGPGGPVMKAKKEPSKPEAKHSNWFGFQDGLIMVATFEFPYSPKNREMSPSALKEYGKVVLEAWNDMDFVK